jgi:maltose O-acetyltransferase
MESGNGRTAIMSIAEKLIWRIRRRQWLKRFRRVGNRFVFDPSSTILTPGLISIGDDVFIGEYAHLSGDISIGNRVMIGPRPVINTGMDVFAIRGMSPRFIKPVRPGFYSPVSIEDEVWLGANVIILGGVTVGIGAVVGAGSVLARSIPPFTVAVGNPCKPIRRIFSDAILASHLREIGYEGEAAVKIVSRRNAELAGLDLPIVDKTDSFHGQIKEVRPA